MIIFLVIGIAAFAYGLLTVTGFIKIDTSKDSDQDKRIFSDKSRYFIGKYWGPIQGMLGGAAFIALYVLTNKQVFDTIASWFSAD